MSWPVRRVLSPRAVTPARVATIHLRRTLPCASSGLPGSSDEQPSNAPCLALLRVGFTEPCRSPGTLVVSYTTVSPLPPSGPRAVRWRSAFCGTVPRVTPGGRYPPPCPVEPGRSSASPRARRGRLASSSAPVSLLRPGAPPARPGLARRLGQPVVQAQHRERAEAQVVVGAQHPLVVDEDVEPL